MSQRRCYPRSLLQRRAIGPIDHDLTLALVVKGQHLDACPVQRDERNRREQQHYYSAEKHPAAARIENQRVHDPTIEARGPSLGLVVAVSTVTGGMPQQQQ